MEAIFAELKGKGAAHGLQAFLFRLIRPCPKRLSPFSLDRSRSRTLCVMRHPDAFASEARSKSDRHAAAKAVPRPLSGNDGPANPQPRIPGSEKMHRVHEKAFHPS
jgi:hypothetical protein